VYVCMFVCVCVCVHEFVCACVRVCVCSGQRIIDFPIHTTVDSPPCPMGERERASERERERWMGAREMSRPRGKDSARTIALAARILRSRQAARLEWPAAEANEELCVNLQSARAVYSSAS
jgi:hypothetical protein